MEAQLSSYKMQVEGLRVHATHQTKPLSQTITQLKEYCLQNQEQDPLIFPIKENPFKEKRSCVIL